MAEIAAGEAVPVYGESGCECNEQTKGERLKQPKAPSYSPSASLTLSSSPARGGAFGVCDTMCQFSVSLHPAQRALSSCPVAGQLGGSRPGKIENNRMAKKKNSPFGLFFFFGIRQLPIFPGRRQPSIVGVQGLNFCVRDGNRWNPLA